LSAVSKKGLKKERRKRMAYQKTVAEKPERSLASDHQGLWSRPSGGNTSLVFQFYRMFDTLFESIYRKRRNRIWIL